MALSKEKRRLRIRRRIRKKVAGTADRPRLAVFRSNKQIYAQVVNDDAGTTLAAATSLKLDTKGKNKTEVAALVGKDIAEKCNKAGIETVIFDRGGYLYHGRVQKLAEAARESGLKF